MSTVNLVFAIIELDKDGKIKVDLKNNKYEIVTTDNGVTCIIEKNTTECCKIGK